MEGANIIKMYLQNFTLIKKKLFHTTDTYQRYTNRKEACAHRL